MGTGTSGVNDSLRDTLVVEAVNLGKCQCVKLEEQSKTILFL